MMPDPKTFDPIATEPAYRSVSRMIENQILSGEIKIGEPLPSELALAARLGVHRSTVREAIRALEQNGLVARRVGGKRLHATLPGGAELSRRVSTAIILREITFFELWEMMLCLETAAAQAAAGRITDEQLGRIAINIKDTKQALADNLSLVELDVEFHALVAEAARNRALNLAREPISHLFFPAFYSVMSRLNAGERLVAAHEQIFDALRRRDEQTARNWMERHIVDFRRGYELANLDIDAPVERPNRQPAPTDRADAERRAE